MVNTITRAEAVLRILKSRGKFFTVTFTKKDKSIRRMTARTGVSKHLRNTGRKQPYKPSEKGLISVFDMGKEAYRLVNVNTVSQLVIGGQTFKVEE